MPDASTQSASAENPCTAPCVVDARVRLPIDRRAARLAPLDALHRGQYDTVLGVSEKLSTATVAVLVETLRGEGVDRAVVHAETEGGEDTRALNEATAELVDELPDLLSGFGTVTLPPVGGGTAAREVRACADLGLVGINVQPAFAGIGIDDRRLYSAYAAAEELELVVGVHTGVNYSRISPMRHERPELFDQVACDFPDLRLVACHGGWPQVAEYCAIARRHPQVYLELGGLSPKYVTRPGTGWDVLAQFLPKLLTEQVLFATDWPVFAPRRALQEWRDAGLPADTLDNVLGRTAEKLLGPPGLRRSRPATVSRHRGTDRA